MVVVGVVNLRIVIISLRHIKPLLPPERHDHQTRHVDGGQHCGQSTDEPKALGEKRIGQTELARDPDLP